MIEYISKRCRWRGSPPPTQLYRNRIVALTPSSFPPGTDPNMVACFQTAGQDESGLVDDRELQRALSSCNQSEHSASALFAFSCSCSLAQTPKGLGTFERFDRDMSGKINGPELREAFLSIGFVVPPVVVDLLGLTKIFKERDTMISGSATFTYEAFTIAILPFLIA
ncbi:hypothetical protein EUGRSUZ_I02592 [Eucalyptus grandis]|uniref:EF-hand domain-containing protein n=2 Tax=Eucalyptus grandis TaxID=71139 RepID=A0A059AU05_EUCGR|nr:hypothetical protein EUGRSUZ_I02592 [Eucalyptus grandis]